MENKKSTQLDTITLNDTLRMRSKLISKIKKMQFLWIESYRIKDSEIESMTDEQLFDTHKIHYNLWIDNPLPQHMCVTPKTCNKCGIQVGKYENHIANKNGVLEWNNDKCRECYNDSL